MKKSLNDKYVEACIKVDKKLMPIKKGESVNKRYSKTSALIFGYSQPNALWRALGFKDSFEVSLHPGSNFNKSDLQCSVHWLMDNGFEIIKR